MNAPKPCLNVLPLMTDTGPRNMAADELMLELVTETEGWLRFYNWSVPTLSLGYFQPIADRQKHPASAQLPVVRRSTGGGAIVHHREVTYALAIPNGPPWHSATPWPCRMHQSIALALGRNGVKAICSEGHPSDGEYLCFRHHAQGDVVVKGAKIVGSAQRRRAGATLQHGSILLMASHHAPELKGIFEMTNLILNSAEIADAIRERLRAEPYWRMERKPFPSDWRDRVTQRAAERYGNDEWTYRR